MLVIGPSPPSDPNMGDYYRQVEVTQTHLYSKLSTLGDLV